MALNPIQTKLNRLKTTDSKNLWILKKFIRVVISAGNEFSLRLLVSIKVVYNYSNSIQIVLLSTLHMAFCAIDVA